MASELTTADVSHRLADQLQVLSQLAETLTFRLLDLEERLAGQELQLQPLLQPGVAGSGLVAEATESRLVETEERLTRLEALLHSGLAAEPASVGEVRHLHSVALEPEGADADDLATEPGDVAPGDFSRADLSLDDGLVAEEALAAEDGVLAEDESRVDSYDADPFLEDHEQAFMDELSA